MNLVADPLTLPMPREADAALRPPGLDAATAVLSLLADHEFVFFTCVTGTERPVEIDVEVADAEPLPAVALAAEAVLREVLLEDDGEAPF